jgi:hypothetical protein
LVDLASEDQQIFHAAWSVQLAVLTQSYIPSNVELFRRRCGSQANIRSVVENLRIT